VSLDVYLESPEHTSQRCVHCGSTYEIRDELYSANITHNLSGMASEAGIYEALWHPEEIGALRARDIIHILRAGLRRLKANPERYTKFDAANGWGTYKNFVPWVERYLRACEQLPDAFIRVSR
jgi:hypothetical protein